MRITVAFYSYFAELAGCAETILEAPPGCSLGDLHEMVVCRFPRLAPLRRSTLLAVGVEYQLGDYQLREDDQVSLFPPVQGG